MSIETRHVDVSVPENLDSARAKLIYVYLAVREKASADEVCADLELDKGAVLSILRALRKYGHVEREGDYYRTA
ncbi:MarR family transcriptional regulator [Natrialbaceae archaeon A-gly3]